jgi:hypothetical protein
MRQGRITAAIAAVLMAGACGQAGAQSSDSATRPATALEDFPHVQISNGLITAQAYPPGEKQLYRGTRFDHAGVVFHVTYKGHDFSTYWFDRFVVDPRDTGKQAPGVETACCAVSGPVEEFAAVGFQEAGPCPEGAQKTECGRFLKPGIGIFTRDNDNPLRFPTLPALNEGKRTFKASKTGARWTQDLDDPQSGYGYKYEKNVQLVPGKPQMTISHVLTNTGKKEIVTTVYCHNFLSLSPGSEHLVITAPFTWSALDELQPEFVKLEGKTIRYIAPLPAGVTTQSLMSGFNGEASDYDFTITNTATGFGQRIRADQPMVKINMWSITPTFSLEPYIAIAIKPGETKRWTYTYDFFGSKQ